MAQGIFWKEYKNISIDYVAAEALANYVVKENLWQNIRQLKRVENFPFDVSRADELRNVHLDKRQLIQKVVFAYKLSESEKNIIGVMASDAYLFKTNICSSPFIHKEARALAINFPIVFEPGKSSVCWYDDNCNEIDRHVLVNKVPLRFIVDTWHTIHNTSNSTPRITLTCSGLFNEWKNILNQEP